MPVSRRSFLSHAVLAAGTVALGGLLASCTPAPIKPGGGGAGAATANNPFGLKANAPGEISIPDQGYGTEWAEKMIREFSKTHPDIDVKMTAVKDMAIQLQPRFIQGNPPDLVMPSNLDVPNLAQQGQLADLRKFFDAPSIDDANVTVADSLLPGVEDQGQLGDILATFSFVYTTYPLWHSKKLFTQHGWSFADNWDDHIALCAEIKKSGIAPWTYAGMYPAYLTDPLLSMAMKLGGTDTLRDIDNLEPEAWTQDAVKQAAGAIEELRAKGYFLEGSSGLSHTESQSYWAQGKAAFIPVGGWLENEMGDVIPSDFEMTSTPTPSLTKSDKLPFAAVAGFPTNQVFVPEAAANAPFGMEFMRFMASKDGARIFTESTKTLTVTKDYTAGLDLSYALQSQVSMIDAAGGDLLSWRLASWYPKMTADIHAKVGLLASGEISAAEFCKQCQQIADRTAKDSTITKYRR